MVFRVNRVIRVLRVRWFLAIFGVCSFPIVCCWGRRWLWEVPQSSGSTCVRPHGAKSCCSLTNTVSLCGPQTYARIVPRSWSIACHNQRWCPVSPTTLHLSSISASLTGWMTTFTSCGVRVPTIDSCTYCRAGAFFEGFNQVVIGVHPGSHCPKTWQTGPW
jgi:hypothetical protein